MKCDYCGQFFSYKDVEKGKAIWRMVLPDSDLTVETWEGICPKHYKRKEDETKKSLR